MGLYDRDYYRDDTSGWWERAGGYRATVVLIVVTSFVYLAQIATSTPPGIDPIQKNFLFDTTSILNGEIWRMVTAQFVTPDVSLFSLVFGMFFLYWAGSELEVIYGPVRFVAFYLAVGVVASLAKLLLGKAGFDSPPTGGTTAVMLGLMVVFACHFPNRTILVMFIIPMPVWVLSSIMIGLYVLMLLSGGVRQEVVAVLTCVAFGYVYYRTGGRILGWVERLGRGRGNERPRRYRPTLVRDSDPDGDSGDEPVAAGASSGRGTSTPTLGGRESSGGRSQVDEHLEAKLDEVLEKMARFGANSLTAEENAILRQASEEYKRRRR